MPDHAGGSRLLLLALPSLVVLALLMAHAARALPRPRAAAFWVCVTLYGMARGGAVGWITVSYLGGGFPYVIRRPLLPVAGVSLQEVAGWAIVLYLGWWLGTLFTSRLFGQILCACLFLASASWAVESTAIAVGWWRWTVPVPAPSLTGVPFIGIVDWFFSGFDFLLPFVALTAPALRKRPSRYLTLLAFPCHFGAHMLVQRPSAWFPIPVYHLAHWLLLGALLWLAARSRVEDRPFAAGAGAAWRWLPALASMIMLAVLAGCDLLVAGRGGLLVSLLPFAVMTAAGANAAGRARARAPVRRAWSSGAGTAGMLIGILALVAWGVHATAARRQAALTDRLDRALALRDKGDLEAAAGLLEETSLLYAFSHVPDALLGELRYRAGRLDDARRRFERAVAIQQSYADGYRYLAVIDLRQGRPGDALRWAENGLDVEPHDPQLLYLLLRARGDSLATLLDRVESLGPQKCHALAQLAFEAGDPDGASSLMEAGLARWPGDRQLHRGRLKLALARGDTNRARQAALAWLQALPGDAEALDAARRLNPE